MHELKGGGGSGLHVWSIEFCNSSISVRWWLHQEFQPTYKVAEVKIICDYMDNFSPGWNYCIQREFQPGLKIKKRINGNDCFSPGWIRLHEKCLAQLGGIPACLYQAGTSPRQSGLKLFPYNRNKFLTGLSWVRHRQDRLNFQPGLKLSM